MMKKQTAVEFLAKSLKDFPHIKHSQSFKDLVKQAKAMEKEQMESIYGKEIIVKEGSDGSWWKREFDQDGNQVYFEDSDGWWVKREFDHDGNQVYYENSIGRIEDNRPKPEPEPVKKQTAVECLYERLERMIPQTALYNMDKKKYFEQAKAMEKEQIEDAWNKRCSHGVVSQTWHIETKNGEQYYNETYGGDK